MSRTSSITCGPPSRAGDTPSKWQATARTRSSARSPTPSTSSSATCGCPTSAAERCTSGSPSSTPRRPSGSSSRPATPCAATPCISSRPSAGPTSTSRSPSPSCAACSTASRPPCSRTPAEPLRVLQVDAGREWRGGQDQGRLPAPERARAGGGLEQLLVTQRGSELARRAGAAGVRVRAVPWGPSLDPRALWHLSRAVATFRPDVLHAHDSHALQLAHWARRLAGANARGRAGAPALVATRRVDFHVRPGSVWLRADRVIAISEAVKGILVTDGVPAARITVVWSGIDADEVRQAAARPLDIRARLGLASRTPLAVNVAALVDHKDHRTLLGAARAARDARPDLHWAIAGEGELRRGLTAEIARLGLADRVHLLGHIADADALI